MGGIGGMEIFIILVAALIIFRTEKNFQKWDVRSEKQYANLRVLAPNSKMN